MANLIIICFKFNNSNNNLKLFYSSNFKDLFRAADVIPVVFASFQIGERQSSVEPLDLGSISTLCIQYQFLEFLKAKPFSE